MAENTHIEWADHTFNPWEGCQKVGTGCDHCYAEARNARFGGGRAPNWGPGAPRRLTSDANWRKPLKWQADAMAFMLEHDRRQRVFCASLADVFDNAVDPMWRARLALLIERTPALDWLLLTKRIGNAAEMLREMFGDRVMPNVWLGATVVNQQEAYRDIPKLLATPATKRFLSIEPMLGPVDLETIQFFENVTHDNRRVAGYDSALVALSPRERSTDGSDPWQSGHDAIDWVICGGESGPNARPMHPDWARSLRDQCAAAGVPFLFKQWGEWLGGHWQGDGEMVGFTSADATEEARQHMRRLFDRDEAKNDDSWWGCLHAWDDKMPDGEGPAAFRVGKARAGRLLDGMTHDGFPA